MQERTQFFVTLGIVLLLLAGCVGLYFFNLELLRSGKLGTAEEREFNAVIGRRFKFDSVIVGTSMSENFKCSEFDKITGGYSYKMTTNGGDISEIYFMVNYAARHQQIKNVLSDLLCYSYLYTEPKSVKLPKELYDDSSTIIDDFCYGLKLTTIRKCLASIMKRSGDGKFDRDKIYSWADETPCGLKPFLLSLFENDFILKKHRSELKNYNAKVVEQNIFNHLIPMIRKHPETTFYLYFPPFTSIELSLSPEAHKHFRKTIMDNLLSLPNVKLYDYQSAEQIIGNYHNYKDITHYSAEINSFIVKAMSGDEYLVSSQNRHIFERKFDDIVSSANFEKLWTYFQKQYDEMRRKK